jgi:hypothetical protein
LFVTAGGAVIRGGALTITVTSLLVDNAPSDAVNRSTYVPFVENVADVLMTLTLPNTTEPLPLTFDHVVLSVPYGAPSLSVAVAFKFTVTTGKVTGDTGEMLTCGAMSPTCVTVKM